MNLKFFKEADSYYAIAEKEVYKGMVCDELWFAEVDKTPTGVMLRWEDSYEKPEPFETFAEARTFILQNYKSHTPLVVGNRYQL